ncbi:MAG: hypothetical protein QN229_00905 [Desulfurococcaceae archaeon TW002]
MGTITNEFVIVVKKDLVRFLRLVKELKGDITYSDTTSNFVRLRFRGTPCNNEFINNMVKFLKESRDLITSCRCLSTYVNRLRILGDTSRGLAVVKSCATGCVTIGNKILCERHTENINLLLETLITPYSLKIRAYLVSAGSYSLASSSLRQVISCDDNLIRKLLSIMCELEKCLSGV